MGTSHGFQNVLTDFWVTFGSDSLIIGREKGKRMKEGGRKEDKKGERKENGRVRKRYKL